MLKNNQQLQEKIEVNNQEIQAIRYSVLKSALLNYHEYELTEGGVTGALYTLADKVDSIFKVKAKNGVFFYYSSEEPQEHFRKKVIITESKEYEELTSKVEEISGNVGSILHNAGNDSFKETNNTDIKYLRKVLSISSQLNDVLKEYKTEKAFEKMMHNKEDDDLPF